MNLAGLGGATTRARAVVEESSGQASSAGSSAPLAPPAELDEGEQSDRQRLEQWREDIPPEQLLGETVLGPSGDGDELDDDEGDSSLQSPVFVSASEGNLGRVIEETPSASTLPADQSESSSRRGTDES